VTCQYEYCVETSRAISDTIGILGLVICLLSILSMIVDWASESHLDESYSLLKCYVRKHVIHQESRYGGDFRNQARTLTNPWDKGRKMLKM